MVLDELFEKAKKEFQALKGEAAKDKLYESVNEFPDAIVAEVNFPAAVKRLLNINKWTEESGIKATFELYDENGKRTHTETPEIGYFIKIILPGVPLDNWVQITDMRLTRCFVEITANPCPDPLKHEDKTAHFFVKETKAIFRVELFNNKITANQIGVNERINNHEEAGSRAIPNTLIAEAGWAGIQLIQWQNLTAFWSGKKDAGNV